MSRVVFALVVIGLTIGTLMLPQQEPPVFGEAAASNPPSVAVCPVEQGSGLDTTVGVVSTVNGSGQFTAFAGGDAAGSTSFATGASGSAVIRVVDVAAVGAAAGLVEMPNVDAASASLLSGAALVAHESCLSAPAPQTVLAGGFTTGGSEFDVRIMNPYAGEARVDLIVRSESGLETASQLKGIAIPSRSMVAVNMDELLPGRETLTVTVDTVAGNVMSGGNLIVGGEGALWNAVTPAVDWYVPAPSGGQGQVVIATGSSSDVAFQVDVYGTAGVVEAFQEGVVPARGEVVVDVESAGVGASAFRVISTEPVAVFLRNVAEGQLAFTNGSTVAASRWLMPGAGLGPGGTGRMVILNAGIEDSSLVLTALRDESVAVELSVAAGAVVEVPAVEGNFAAYTLRSEGLFVPLWVTSAGAAGAYSLGVPLIDE
jgi:hypothetical protein